MASVKEGVPFRSLEGDRRGANKTERESGLDSFPVTLLLASEDLAKRKA